MEYSLFDDNALLNDGSDAANNQGINICKECCVLRLKSNTVILDKVI